MTDQSLLAQGERLLWSEAPRPGQYVIFKCLWASVFGLLFILVFWVLLPDSVSKVLFVWAGLIFVLWPAWCFLRALRTTYLLTDRRAVIDARGIFPRRVSVPLHEIKFVEQRPSALGTGSVLFRELPLPESGTIKDGFIAIADAVRIEKMLRAEINKAVAGRQWWRIGPPDSPQPP